MSKRPRSAQSAIQFIPRDKASASRCAKSAADVNGRVRRRAVVQPHPDHLFPAVESFPVDPNLCVDGHGSSMLIMCPVCQ